MEARSGLATWPAAAGMCSSPLARAARAPESEIGRKMSLISASASQVPEAFTQSTSPCLTEELPPAACVSRMFLPTRADMRRSSFRIAGCRIFKTSPGQIFNHPMRRAGFRAGQCADRLGQVSRLRECFPMNAGADEGGQHSCRAAAGDIVIDRIADDENALGHGMAQPFDG